MAPLVATLAITACSAGGGSSSVPGANKRPSGTLDATSNATVPEWQAKHLAKQAVPMLAPANRSATLIVKSGLPMKPDVAGWATSRLHKREFALPSSTNGGGQIDRHR